LVLSRTISDLNFRLAHARIYNHNIDLLVATGEAENCTLQPANALILLSYIDTKVSTWITSVDNVAFTSLIPTTLTSDTLFAVDHNDGGIIGVLGKFNGVYQCGQTHTSQTTIESRFPVVVPPMSKVKVSLLATKASCNIPFYYSQQDNLISPHPRTITYHKEGGVYTGVSFYNFKHKKEEEPLAG
ncbi:PREDICTED: Hfr-2, partial [Prunus dulcis]